MLLFHPFREKNMFVDQILQNILRNGVELSCPEARIPQSALIVLRKCAWAAARLLSTSPDVGSTPFARGMASCLVPLFILSHADELSLSCKFANMAP